MLRCLLVTGADDSQALGAADRAASVQCRAGAELRVEAVDRPRHRSLCRLVPLRPYRQVRQQAALLF